MRPHAWLAGCLLLLAQFAQAQATPTAIVKAARQQVGVTRSYDPAYVRLAYPNGDVPADRGVCSDVVVRAYRKIGVDFQKLLHQDMAAHFKDYPALWGLSRPDSKIDHRRVPNLRRYLERQGKAVAVTDRSTDYLPGDIVSWRLPNGLAHVGIVSDRKVGFGLLGRPLVIHNIGYGAQEEDVLFSWQQTGHYRWISERGVAAR